ncbi:GNAT family N-acetyltransferase [Sulfitobacter aestuariivivens]|uniref:GNAT family N-acetyltransferase n=1 Tax=Sulfitobacter aestuariivivens TaxID=2766981 RepID=UPI0031B56BB4
MADKITLNAATTAADLAAVRDLCWAYRDLLEKLSPVDAAITRFFYPEDKYTTLMNTLAEVHARPTGLIVLAKIGDRPVGCGMSHALDTTTSEIKRVFVTETARGRGVARMICYALEDQARRDGFARLVLDTSVALKPAQRLYETLGFQRCGPYQPTPKDMLPKLVFFEKQL